MLDISWPMSLQAFCDSTTASTGLAGVSGNFNLDENKKVGISRRADLWPASTASVELFVQIFSAKPDQR